MRPIIVIGSLNMDLVIQAQRAPQAGETIAAQAFTTIPGGKGANQAVAAARLSNGSKGSSKVRMVGRVGSDGFGAQMVHNLEGEGIDITQVQQLPGISTGVALIIVEQSGENRIMIVPGANGLLTARDIENLEKLIASAGLVLLQFEIPLEAVIRSIQIAHAHGVPVLLNPAPAYPFAAEHLAQVDILVLNEVEAQMLTRLPVSDELSALEAARSLLTGHTRLVVVTLGTKGALALAPDEAWYLPAFPVRAVDSTAAGDTFIGAFAVMLSEKKSLEKCLAFASAAGALAVTQVGAQSSIPTRLAVENFLRTNQAVIKALA